MNTNLTGFARFESSMVNLAQAVLLPVYRVKQEAPTASPKIDEIFQTVFGGFTEISSTIDALRLTLILLSTSPPRSKRLKHDEYLKFLISGYLQEVYILKERLKSYATKVQRLYGVHLQGGTTKNRLDELVKGVETAFAGLVSTRGSHVHAARYSDRDLDLVSSLSLISRNTPDPEFDPKLSYKHASRKWAKKVEENNIETQKLIDVYFDWVFIGIAKEGQIFLPPSTTQRRRA